MQKNTFWKKWIIRLSALLGIAFVLLSIHAKIKKKDTVYTHLPEEKNPMEGKEVVFIEEESDPVNADGVRGHLEAIGESSFRESFYTRRVKRTIDLLLSFFALIFLSPLFLALSLAIIIDDPGPVFFTQKRVGKNKQYFQLHKFRSMKMCTPHDTPTHMLKNPEQYITRVGKFIRAHSLDELPQIWDIFVGNMSLIGPRPGLWNQDCLIAERDKYHANDVMPGLSGLAQISGRDELEISEKAKIDGEYVEKIGFLMDMRCLFGTVFAVLGKKGVVEGGTGNKKENQEKQQVLRENKGTALPLEGTQVSGIRGLIMKEDNKIFKILITGAHSYVGEQVEKYLEEYNKKIFEFSPEKKRYIIETISLYGEEWKKKDFSCYDVVFHVAGIAHGRIKENTEEEINQYFAVNRDLAQNVAVKAKNEGISQFIFMSTMAVYGGIKDAVITKETIPSPISAYGESKLQAEWLLEELEDEKFTVAILRPPMIYGHGCKGNYTKMVKLARLLPVFPEVGNSRSMIYIENLAEFIRLLIENREGGVFFPQNDEYIDTGKMIRLIAKSYHWTCILLPGFKTILKFMQKLPGKVGRISKKAFSSLYYQQEYSDYRENYRIFSLEDSIKRIEEIRKKG